MEGHDPRQGLQRLARGPDEGIGGAQVPPPEAEGASSSMLCISIDL